MFSKNSFSLNMVEDDVVNNVYIVDESRCRAQGFENIKILIRDTQFKMDASEWGQGRDDKESSQLNKKTIWYLFYITYALALAQESQNFNLETHQNIWNLNIIFSHNFVSLNVVLPTS